MLQALRFAIVGVGNTATCIGVIWLLREGRYANVATASAAGYAVAMVQSYLLNRFWTFGGGGGVRVGRQAAAFVAVNLLCLGLFTVINVLLHRWFGITTSSLLTTVLVTPVSFALNRWFVFRA